MILNKISLYLSSLFWLIVVIFFLIQANLGFEDGEFYTDVLLLNIIFGIIMTVPMFILTSYIYKVPGNNTKLFFISLQFIILFLLC